jgi:uncharacterized membrane protein HdeD (DUF308 family)
LEDIKEMLSFLNKIINIFFEKPSTRIKPIMFLQIILGAFAIFVWFQARSTAETPVHHTYSGLLRIVAGFVLLLTGIENCVNKKSKKEYIKWFVLALMFFGMAIDQFFS